MRVAWRFIGGFGRCLRFIGGWKSAVAADYNRKKERRYRTAKLFDLSVSEGIKKEPKQVAGEIHFFFTRKNFNVKSKVRESTKEDSDGFGKCVTGLNILTMFVD
ncbi:hypothetical protein Bca52824_065888 [Brassica carinata]|uniref:Uncharacterized protein n=1 Tax=Brassica carinata TaxID=52824 RepID=A0A8X7QKH1_BRACI|nr:hypothetical protein Bca52824_065888 [Brassica carinata]